MLIGQQSRSNKNRL